MATWAFALLTVFWYVSIATGTPVASSVEASTIMSMVTSISEFDMGYVLALTIPDSVGADFTLPDNTKHHNCVVLFHTRSRFQNGDIISGRMYLDNDYSAAYCNFHQDFGIPEGVCTSLD